MEGWEGCGYWGGIGGVVVYIVYRDTLLFFCLSCCHMSSYLPRCFSISIEFLVEIRISKWRTSNVIMESIV